MLQTNERAPTLFPSNFVTFGLTIESIKEFKGAALMLKCYLIGYVVHT
jgi:hypothetical protein